MEIKRNIFDSTARMPAQYDPVAVPVTKEQINPNTLVGLQKSNMGVRHVPIPRIGEQK